MFVLPHKFRGFSPCLVNYAALGSVVRWWERVTEEVVDFITVEKKGKGEARVLIVPCKAHPQLFNAFHQNPLFKGPTNYQQCQRLESKSLTHGFWEDVQDPNYSIYHLSISRHVAAQVKAACPCQSSWLHSSVLPFTARTLQFDAFTLL